MSKIKGWTQYYKRGDFIEYQHVREDDERSIVVVKKHDNIWKIEYKSPNFAWEELESLKTKKRAVTFAIKWMRYHPEG